jgi:hypothetical protein
MGLQDGRPCPPSRLMRSTNFIKYMLSAARSVAQIQPGRTVMSLLISAARARLNGGGRLHQPEAVALGLHGGAMAGAVACWSGG